MGGHATVEAAPFMDDLRRVAPDAGSLATLDRGIADRFGLRVGTFTKAVERAQGGRMSAVNATRFYEYRDTRTRREVLRGRCAACGCHLSRYNRSSLLCHSHNRARLIAVREKGCR